MSIVEKIRERISKPIVQHLPPPVESHWALPTMLLSPDPNDRDNRALTKMALAACRAAADEVGFGDLAARPNCKPWLTVWPGEHYKLLGGLMLVLRPKVAIEVGTAEGLSALAMKKYIPAGGKVVTFDIVPWQEIPDTLLTSDDFADGRLEQRLGDLGDRNVFDSNRELIESADFIFIDGPKDNNFEWKLLEYFKSTRFARPPILMFDDTRLWSMLKFWRDLPYPKLDLTSFGHCSGTGLVQWEQD